MSRVTIEFTVDELWMLQSCVRHEVSQQDTWHFPPASLELNDQVAAALVFCADGEKSAWLELSRGDLLVIDAVVSESARDVDGRPLGRNILLKSYRGRADLDSTYPVAEEPAMPEREVIAAGVNVASQLHASERLKGQHR